MELIRDFCSGVGCGQLLPIVNKKYWLCQDCNFKRTHHGQSKEDVYRERANRRKAERQNIPNEIRGSKGRFSLDDETLSKFKLTKASKLTSVSSKKRYYCSDGSMVSQSEIKFKLSITCDKIKETRLPICEGTGRSDVPLSFSHTISQARCKELKKTELIWDECNIELEGFEAPCSNPTAAHNTWEVGSIEKKIQLLNFDRKLAYIKEHDQEEYQRLMIKIEELEQRMKNENYEE